MDVAYLVDLDAHYAVPNKIAFSVLTVLYSTMDSVFQPVQVTRTPFLEHAKTVRQVARPA